jgi:hypothetical protein
VSLLVPFHRAVQRSASWAEGRPVSTQGVTLTSGGSAHALGTKVEVFASTTHDTTLVRIALAETQAAATRTDALCNIYVGADTAEQVLIPNLAAGWSGHSPKFYEFPLFIPAGTRISADLQALIVSDTAEVLMELFGGGSPIGWCGSRVECVGADTASSIGTSVTPGTTSEGSFTSIGTTVNEWRYIFPYVQGMLADSNIQSQMIALDIGVGGSIYKGLEEFWFASSSNENVWPGMGNVGRFSVIPASTALQARGQVEGATAEAFDVLIYGVY